MGLEDAGIDDGAPNGDVAKFRQVGDETVWVEWDAPNRRFASIKRETGDGAETLLRVHEREIESLIGLLRDVRDQFDTEDDPYV